MMHRDSKIGLALGVLLVGVVAAFFFRNDEPRTLADAPQLADAAALDETIAEKPVIPYLQGGIETLPTSETERAGTGDVPAVPKPPTWDVPDFLRDGVDDETTEPVISLDPLPPVDATSTSSVAEASPAAELPPAAPRHNDDWEGLPSRGERPTTPVRGRVHVVRNNDTLSGIAARYLGSAARYRDIYEANRDVLRSPDDLKIGQKLRIPNRTTTAARPTASTSRSTPAKPVATETDDSTDEIPGPEPKPERRFVPARRSPFVPAARPRRISQVAPSTNDR